MASGERASERAKAVNRSSSNEVLDSNAAGSLRARAHLLCGPYRDYGDHGLAALAAGLWSMAKRRRYSRGDVCMVRRNWREK